MKLHFLGAVRSTTGSMHLLETRGKKILFDCGMFQGPRALADEKNTVFPFDPKEIDALIVSHAHIDHSGNIPTLVKQGFRGNIYSTFATRDLCSIMLEDSADIQLSDTEFINKKRAKKGLAPVKPYYNKEDADRALRQFVSIGYDREIPVLEHAALIFRDAGHILGSAITTLQIDENSRPAKLVFSGDLGRGGRIIIPAFAVGRTQQVVYSLHLLLDDKLIPNIPVFVDSPLAVNATEVYRLHPECYDEETYQFLRQKKNPFGYENIIYIRNVGQSMALNEDQKPCIIISSSGMCEGGRIRHHLKHNIGNPLNTILIVGFCAEGTLGRKLIDGEKEVRIFGEEYEVKAEVVTIDAFSAHADKGELLHYLKRTGIPFKEIFLVHGETDQSKPFSHLLKKSGVKNVKVPKTGDVVELTT